MRNRTFTAPVEGDAHCQVITFPLRCYEQVINWSAATATAITTDGRDHDMMVLSTSPCWKLASLAVNIPRTLNGPSYSSCNLTSSCFQSHITEATEQLL